jgi:hypothetical protein
MSQRNILENSIQLAKTLKGPAKMLWAPATQGMPTIIQNIIDPTTGAPAAGWTAFGTTRGGINITKNLDIAVRDDIDQIYGAYDQDLNARSYTVTSQLGEVLDRTQMGVAWETGTATMAQSATVGGATQMRTNMDSGSNKPTERRLAVVYPKQTDGKVWAFAFRRASLTGGDKTLRFDRGDSASPPLEFRTFPEIASYIASEEAYGYIWDIE